MLYVCFSVRVMRLEKQAFQSLGLEVTGGNLVGIYVKELTDDSVCKAVGLNVGDRLFKVCDNLTKTKLGVLWINNKI